MLIILAHFKFIYLFHLDMDRSCYKKLHGVLNIYKAHNNLQEGNRFLIIHNGING